MNFKPHQSTFDDKLSAIIGLVIGLVFITGSFWVNNKVAHERATLIETQGMVVDTISRRERNSKDQLIETYAPVIEFVAKGDRTRFTGNYESYCSSNGNMVVVRYDPKQPATTARVVNPLEDLVSWVVFGMGGLTVVFSLGNVLPIRWSSDRQADS